MVTACSVDGSMVVSGLTESPLILSDKPHLSQLQFPAPVFKYAYCTAVFFFYKYPLDIIRNMLFHQTPDDLPINYVVHYSWDEHIQKSSPINWSHD